MKKSILVLAITVFISLQVPVLAQTIDSQIEDALSKKAEQEMLKSAKNLDEKITFTKVNSCKSMEKVLGDFLETYKKLNPKRPNYYFRNFMTKWADTLWLSNDMAMAPEVVNTSQSVNWWEIKDFSTTNIQKIWVDEPEILKSNGKYLFYYSNTDYAKWYISIIKAPTKKDLSDAEIVAKINIPSWLYNIQLFLDGNKLVILGSRDAANYDSALGSQRTIVIIYDISNVDNLKLEKLTEVYGSFEDARMIWDQIYLASSINLNWYNIVRWDEPILFNNIQPKTTEITLKRAKESDSSITGLYQKTVSKIPCDKIFYLLPSEETMKESWIYPNFTLISQISITDLSSPVDQNLVFGNVNEVHMSQSSLYLPSPIYFSKPMRCWLRWCIGSRFYREWNTLIHKFNLEKKLAYQDSTIIPWSPLNQYSMDEDDDGNFRILTTTWHNQNATHLVILDKNLKIKWTLMNIEPWENFKSSRYIWDKLYLVTYQNIDPLFVVDMEDISNPKIIWELKIPGYSTYLHSYSDAKNWVQYLIWLWYSTKDNGYGWLTNDNVKVDLYKIDYKSHENAETKCSSLITNNVNPDFSDSCKRVSTGNTCNTEQKIYEDCISKVNPENIAVSLIASHEFSWDSSNSPALYNPRVFVWRSAKQELILPVNIRTLISKWDKYKDDKYDEFIGLKWLSIKNSTALIKEFLSQNFATNNGNYYWDFDNARVGYIDDVYYFLNKGFAAFLTKEWKVATLWAM